MHPGQQQPGMMAQAVAVPVAGGKAQAGTGYGAQAVPRAAPVAQAGSAMRLTLQVDVAIRHGFIRKVMAAPSRSPRPQPPLPPGPPLARPLPRDLSLSRAAAGLRHPARPTHRHVRHGRALPPPPPRPAAHPHAAALCTAGAQPGPGVRVRARGGAERHVQDAVLCELGGGLRHDDRDLLLQGERQDRPTVPRPPAPAAAPSLPRITQPDAWPGCLRRNYILLSICTVAEGLMLGVISSFYTTESVLLAAGAPSPPHPCQRTRGDEHGAARSRTVCGLILGAPDLCAGLTLIIAVFLIVFAFQTKYDFTGIGPYLMVALLCLVLFAFVMIIFTDSRVSATLRLLSD